MSAAAGLNSVRRRCVQPRNLENQVPVEGGERGVAFAKTTREFMQTQNIENGRHMMPIAEALGWKGHEPPRS